MEVTEKPISLAILEDDEIFRLEVCSILDRSAEVVIGEQYSSIAAASASPKKPNIDVMLVDLGLPDGSGVEAIDMLRVFNEHMQFIVLTSFDDDGHLFPAFEAGATGYILKNQMTESVLVESIKEVLAGGSPISSSVARRITEYFRDKGAKKEVSASVQILTRRECEVLDLAGKGYNSTKKIAQILEVSAEAIKSHKRNIYRKLHAHSIVEALIKYNGSEK